MTGDLHDIDDLFRDGLEGHEEAVPSEVWQTVSNDLDKKQASYYKHKYKRLRYAAALLLLLCLLGTVYVTFDVVKDRHTNKSVSSKPSGTNAVTSSEERHKEEPASTVERYPQPAGQNETIVTKTTPPTQDDNRKATDRDENGSGPVNGIHEKSAADVPLLSPNSVHLKSTKRPSFVAKNDQTGLPVNNAVARHSLTEEPQGVAKEFFALPYFSLAPKDLRLPAIAPANFSQHLSVNLPQKKATTQAKAARGTSLFVFAAPNISFDRLEDNNHLAGPGRNRQVAHREERGNTSFSGGLLLNHELTRNWSLQSGVTVTTSSTSIAPKTVYAKPDNNGHNRYELHCSSGYVYISPKGGAQPAVGDSARAVGTTSKLTYVTVPASMSYRINAGRLSVSPSLGLGLNILASGRAATNLSNTVANESTTTTISGLKQTYVDGHIGIGIEYGLGPKLTIGIRPNARLALTPINQETPVKSYQNFLSIETGVRIKL